MRQYLPWISQLNWWKVSIFCGVFDTVSFFFAFIQYVKQMLSYNKMVLCGTMDMISLDISISHLYGIMLMGKNWIKHIKQISLLAAYKRRKLNKCAHLTIAMCECLWVRGRNNKTTLFLWHVNLFNFICPYLTSRLFRQISDFYCNEWQFEAIFAPSSPHSSFSLNHSDCNLAVVAVTE